jgi:hypothetical protein
MSDQEQFTVICRFPGWEQDGHKFGAFGRKYLVTTGILQFPDWPDDDQRWLRYDDLKPAKDAFKAQFAATIGHEFDGEILFVERSDFTVLTPTQAIQDTGGADAK